MTQPSVERIPVIVPAFAEYAPQMPEMTQVPRGGTSSERIASSRRNRSYMDSPPRSVSFQASYMPSQNVRDGAYPYSGSGYVHQEGSHPSLSPWGPSQLRYHHSEPTPHPSLSPWEPSQLRYHHSEPTPVYNGYHENIPSPAPRSVRYFTRSDSRSTGSSGPHEHISQQPFVVMQEHPVPLWDRYVSVHPFQHRPSVASASLSPSRYSSVTSSGDRSADLPPPASYSSPSSTSIVKQVLNAIYVFLFDLFPRHVYLSLLLGLPSLYFTRVARVFEDAELSKPDIRKMVHTTANEWEGRMLPFTMNWNQPTHLSPALLTFKRSWEEFVDSLMREWKTLNVISVLLLSAILTVLQIQGAGDDPVTRTAALVSLICALMSLAYGCMYIVRFGTMKKMHKASSWADEARKTDTLIWWNVWVLLAMPAVWLAWSMALFLLCILSFVWRSGSMLDPTDRSPLTPHVAMGVRVGISGVLALGLLYALMIVKTLSRYGARMDEAWTNRALAWRLEDLPQPMKYCHRPGSDESVRSSNKYEALYGSRTQVLLYRPAREDSASPKSIPMILPGTRTPHDLATGDSTRVPTARNSVLFSNSIPNPPNNLHQPVPPTCQAILSNHAEDISRPSTPDPPILIPQDPTALHSQPDDALTIPSFLFRPANLAISRPFFASIKIQDDMANLPKNESSTPSVLLRYDVYPDEWSRFMLDISTACTGRFPILGVEQSTLINQSDLIADLVDVWNDTFFCNRGLKVSVLEDRSGSPSIAGEMKNYALYLNGYPETSSPGRVFGRLEGDRLSYISERTEPSSLENETLGRLRSLPGGYDDERDADRGTNHNSM